MEGANKKAFTVEIIVLEVDWEWLHQPSFLLKKQRHFLLKAMTLTSLDLR